MQFVALALPPVRSKVENKFIGSNTTKPEAPRQSKSYLFPTVTATPKNSPRHNDKTTVLLSEPFEFFTNSTIIVFKAKPTKKLCTTYEISTSAMHVANYVFDNGADVNLIRPLMIPSSWTLHIKRKEVPWLRRATRQLLPLDGSNFFYLHPGQLSICTWFGVAPYLPKETLHGASFIDHFIFGIFLAECKVVLWNSRPVAILARGQTLHDTCI